MQAIDGRSFMKYGKIPTARVMTGLLALVLLGTAPILLGGQQGRILGTVTDGKGTPLEGVKITVTTSAITNFKVSLTTAKDGKWGTILNDATLKYHYRFEKDGFLPTEQDKKVPIAESVVLDIQLLNQQQAIEKGFVKQVIDPFTAAYNEAVEKFQADDFDGAMVKAEEATKAGPEKANGFDLAAKIAYKKQNWDKVIEYGERALALEPDNTALFGLLTEAHRAKGNKEKVKEYEKKFVEANPDKPEVVYNQAVERYNKSDFKGAEPLLKKVVEAKPDYASAHFLLGMCYVNLNKISSMKEHLNEYIKLDPTGKDVSTAKEMLDAFK
jgi:tetratricopeptide (TPR) repeat protein